jgi:hypothetical protein
VDALAIAAGQAVGDLNIKTTSTSLKVTYKTVAQANQALRERGITDVMVNEILKLEAPKKK